MKNEFYKLLVHPLSKSVLNYLEKENILQSEQSGEQFEILENVPILLKSKEKNSTKSSFHKEQNSTFEYIDHYEKDALFFDYSRTITDALVYSEQKRLHEAILSEIEASDLVLDVGCGRAWVAQQLCVDKNNRVISMDISRANPINAIKNNPKNNHFAVVADVYNLPFKPDTFDTIIASEIIEHVADPKIFIDKLIEVLKPKGKLIISTPYNEKIEYSLCVHCNKPTPRNAHIHSFSEKNIKDYLPDNLKAIDYKLKLVNNTILTKLRIQKFFSFLPFKLWQAIDSVTTKIIKRPARLLLVIQKLK